MNGTTLAVFFFLALICVALSITNYLNITIFGDENELEDFKGNRSGFLDITGESVVVTTFDNYGDPEYKTNALTVQDTPVNIQILNSNTKEASYAPTLNITNISTSNVDFNFKTNVPKLGSTTASSINVLTDSNNDVTRETFTSGGTQLGFNNNGNVFGTALFNFAPYLSVNTVTVPKTTSDTLKYSVSTNTTYLVPQEVYDAGTSFNGANCWFFLPRDNVIPGDHINFVFTNVASTVNDGKTKITKWGPPGYIAKNSFIDNWYLANDRVDNLAGAPGNFGIQQNSSTNFHLTGNFKSGQLKQSSTNNTPAGTLVKFSALATTPITWAVELDTVQPFCAFYFENDWSPPGTASKQI